MKSPKFIRPAKPVKKYRVEFFAPDGQLLKADRVPALSGVEAIAKARRSFVMPTAVQFVNVRAREII